MSNIFQRSFRSSAKPFVTENGRRNTSESHHNQEGFDRRSVPLEGIHTSRPTTAVTLEQQHTAVQQQEDDPQPSNILRRSVVILEKDRKDRRKAIILFVSLTAALTFLTPLYVIRGLGLIPQFPDVGALTTSVSNYYTYCKRINAQLATDINSNYSIAEQMQAADCQTKSDASYAELVRIRDDCTKFADQYCDDVLRRLYSTSYIKSLPPSSKYPGSCPSAAIQANSGNWQYLTIWTIDQTKYKSSYEISPDATYLVARPAQTSNNRFLFGIFVLSSVPNRTTCPSIGELWDNFLTSSTNQYRCSRFKEMMNANLSVNNQSSSNYLSSTKNYIDYSDQFGFNVSSFANSLLDAYNSLGQVAGGMRTTVSQWQAELGNQLNQAKQSKTAFDNAYGSISTIAEGAKQLGALDLSSPVDPSTIIKIPNPPTAALDNLNQVQQQLLTTHALLRDYNPPPVNWPAEDVQYNYTVPKPGLVVPSLSLKNSILVKEIIAAFNALKSLMEYFLAYDIALRVCLWLQDIAFLFLEPRRNFIKLSTRGKNCLAFFFQHLALFLYLGVFLAIVIIAATFGYNPDTVVKELQAACHNQVLVQNDNTLTGYKNSLVAKKVSCNNSLLSINTQMGTMDRTYIDMLRTFSGDYEVFYNASAPLTEIPGTSIDNFNYGSRKVNKNFSLAPAKYPVYGKRAEYQYYFSFDDYQIPTGLCSDTQEAKDVSNAIKYNTALLGQYIVSILMVGLGTVICLKFLIWGLQRWYWMELTKGYVMEMDITSAMVKSRIRSYKIQAVILWSVSFLLFIIDLAVFSTAIKNVKI